MDAIDMIVNSLPAPTWNHLNMNRATVKNAVITGSADLKITGNCIEKSEKQADFESIETGMGKDVTSLLKVNEVESHLISVNKNKEETVELRYLYKTGDNAGNTLLVDVDDNAKLTLIMDYSSVDSGKGFAAVQTKLNIKKNALVKLIQVSRLSDEFTHLNDVGAILSEDSSLEVIQIVLSGEKNYNGLLAELSGRESSFKADIGYAVKNEEEYDVNYVIRHKGKKTDCDIKVNGSLRDKSVKTFRGTIDFIRGAEGATGSEVENVLVIDNGTINRTIPLILCEEEDVEGNHGATIGRPDEELLFYLASRGINEEKALDMLAKAGIDAVVNKIPDGEYKKEIETYYTR